MEAARTAGKLKVDYVGILLIAIGFASLEVVLDRGERLDWFENNFIISCFAIAMAALGFAIFWELHHPDPVVEIRLLKERNFAIANAYYFLFGLVLFGSTVLIPQMLQSLYGYTATDAGLVLGPGAMVIVVQAPVVVRLVSRIPVARLLAFGFAILALAMWYFAGFNLVTNYARETGARALQGLGIAFLFVPATQLAYSYLPKEKNNQASSVTNLFRNQGGSFGIALVTTLLSQRMQYHQSVLVTHVTTFDQRLTATVTGITNRFVEHGSSMADASVSALAQVYAIVQQQAAMLAFLDCFRILGAVAFIGVPLGIFIRKFKQGGSAAAH